MTRLSPSDVVAAQEAMIERQAATTWKGRPWKRWYVYATDGWRYVVWEETPEGALDKARRSRSVALSERVDPAPPLLDERSCA